MQINVTLSAGRETASMHLKKSEGAKMKKSTAILALVSTMGLGVAVAQQENETKRQDPMPNPKTIMDDKHRDANQSASDKDKKNTDRDSNPVRKKHRRHKKLRHKPVKKDVGAEAAEHDSNPGA